MEVYEALKNEAVKALEAIEADKITAITINRQEDTLTERTLHISIRTLRDEPQEEPEEEISFYG